MSSLYTYLTYFEVLVSTRMQSFRPMQVRARVCQKDINDVDRQFQAKRCLAWQDLEAADELELLLSTGFKIHGQLSLVIGCRRRAFTY